MYKSAKYKYLESQLKKERAKMKSPKYRQKIREEEIATKNKWFINTAKDFREDLIKNKTRAETKVLTSLLHSDLKEAFEFQKAIFVKKKSEIIKFYIADFYFDSCKLLLEIDGGYHNEEEQKLKDASRDLELQRLGYKTIRISNEEASTIDVVKALKTILYEIL